MDEILPESGTTILIYGGQNQGKSTVVDYITRLRNPVSILCITGSIPRYRLSLYDYNHEIIDKWINNISARKVMIMDDFMHLNTMTGNHAQHLKGLSSTPRHYNLDLIVSTHLLSCGKYFRDIARVFILFRINNKMAEDLLRNNIGFTRKKIDSIRRILLNRKHAFICFNDEGNYKIIELDI